MQRGRELRNIPVRETSCPDRHSSIPNPAPGPREERGADGGEQKIWFLMT